MEALNAWRNSGKDPQETTKSEKKVRFNDNSDNQAVNKASAKKGSFFAGLSAEDGSNNFDLSKIPTFEGRS